MRRPLVAGNWKLHGSRAANAALLGAIRAGLDPAWPIDVMVCPPFVYLAEACATLAGSPLLVGAQNASAESQGAFTGEVSAAMLRDVGCSHAIVGHSERRALYGESDETVARKFKAVVAAGLAPILCVGETLAERKAGATHAVVQRQLDAVFAAVTPDELGLGIIAYEPVWAIGTGRTATPEQAQDVHAFIRRAVAARSARMAGELRILYGGSVKGANARALFAMPDIDGGLVGGASLDAGDYLMICGAAAGTAT
jgi:triosephosphate isomerase